MRKLILFCVATTLLGGCSSILKNLQSKGATTVKFEYFDNRILVPVTINDQGPFYMIFDTGGSNMLVPEAASKLNLTLKDAGLGGGAGDKKRSLQATKVEAYKVGAIEMRDQDFLVMDLSEIKKAFGFARLDGIIGYELLKKYVATINYDQQTIAFTDFDSFKPKGDRVKFRLFADKPVIQSQIQGVATEILVDTGDRSSFTLFKKFSAKNKLSGHFFKKEVVSGYGVGGPIPAYLGVLPKVDLGDEQVQLREVFTRLPRTQKGFFAKSDLGGSLGNGVLQNFVVSFNYRDQEMIFGKGQKKQGEYKFVPPKVP